MREITITEIIVGLIALGALILIMKARYNEKYGRKKWKFLNLSRKYLDVVGFLKM